MKQKILVSLLILNFNNLQSQNQNLDINLNNNQINIIKENGLYFKNRPINSYEELDGNPYFYDNFKEALITLNNNKQIYINKGNIDLFSNEFIYEDENKNILTPNIDVLEVTFIDNFETRKSVNKFEYVLFNNKKYLVKVYNNGTIKLLENIKISIKDGIYSPLEGNIPKKKFIKTSYFYLINNNQLNYLNKLNFNNIHEILKFNNKTIEWLNKNKNKLNSKDKIIEFLNYYNNN